MENKDIIKQVFESKDFTTRNRWFFEAQWKNIHVLKFNTSTSWFACNGGTWINGNWMDGVWENGIWKHGTWHNGIWKNGTWENGNWKAGIWENGNWLKGNIYNPKTGKYKISKLPPNECEWSLSYKK